jgi:hypothetical protein
MYTIKDHPQKSHIEGLQLEYLLNRKPYAEYAVSYWRKIKNSTKEEKEFNINYFEIELELINKQIKKYDNKGNSRA